jgi:hypothetical protein
MVVMGTHEPWQEKFRRFFKEMTGRGTPIHVVPRRRSDPVGVPSDWWTDEGQRKVTPQCVLCHERQIEGSPPLRRGMCGACYLRTSTTDDAA